MSEQNTPRPASASVANPRRTRAQLKTPADKQARRQD